MPLWAIFAVFFSVRQLFYTVQTADFAYNKGETYPIKE